MLKKTIFAFFMLNLSFARAAEDSHKESKTIVKVVCFPCETIFEPTYKKTHEKKESHQSNLRASNLKSAELIFKEVEIQKNNKCDRCHRVFSSPTNVIMHREFNPNCNKMPVAAPYTYKPFYPDEPGITNIPKEPLSKHIKRKILDLPKAKPRQEPEYIHCLTCGYDFRAQRKTIHEDSQSHKFKAALLLKGQNPIEKSPLPVAHRDKRKKSEELDSWVSAQPTCIENPPLLFDFDETNQPPFFDFNLEHPLPIPILPADFVGTNPFSEELPTPLFDFGQPDCMSAQPSSTENQSLPVVNLDSTDPLYLPEPFDPDQNFFE